MPTEVPAARSLAPWVAVSAITVAILAIGGKGCQVMGEVSDALLTKSQDFHERIVAIDARTTEIQLLTKTQHERIDRIERFIEAVNAERSIKVAEEDARKKLLAELCRTGKLSGPDCP